MSIQNLLVELFVEELPPRALRRLGEAFAQTLSQRLLALGLAADDSVADAFASPRRLGVHLSHVAAKAADRVQRHKLMPVAVGLDAQGLPTPALRKKLAALGQDLSDPAQAVAQLQRAPDGKSEALFLETLQSGATLDVGLQIALDEAIAKLPIPKVMSYQLARGCALPGWSSVSFVRPAHSLLALHGTSVVPVQALGLQADRITHGHRFEAQTDPIVVAHADAYAEQLAREGAVIARFDARRAEIERQLQAAAAQVGGGCQPIADPALLDEVTALVERPNVLVCAFEPAFLAVPQECLILTMKANQKYFPLLDASARLTHRFLLVSNITPQDPSAVIAGNERVVRPRLADAQFFFEQDRKRSLSSRLGGLDKVVYHNQLGSQGERSQRVVAIAGRLIDHLVAAGLTQAEGWRAAVSQAAALAKTDLLTDMVGEFPELQGIMGGYYARHDGLGDEVALAIEDHYRPRFAGDALPRNTVGMVVALADKLETLVGLFGIGQQPNGEKDPFALRRHALGVIRMGLDTGWPLAWPALLEAVADVFGPRLTQPRAALLAALHGFIADRLAGLLRDQGYSSLEIDAVLALAPARLADVPRRLAAVRAFIGWPEAPALAAANKRIANILKKADAVPSGVDEAHLVEPAEIALHQAMRAVLAQAQAQAQAGDLTGSLATLAALRTPVDAFFEGVMVNADDPALKRNRLALLATLHQAMNQVADLGRLAA